MISYAGIFLWGKFFTAVGDRSDINPCFSGQIQNNIDDCTFCTGIDIGAIYKKQIELTQAWGVEFTFADT